MTSDDESIFLNQSVSQIVTEPDSSIDISYDEVSNSQTAPASMFKSIGPYFIIENNLLCLAEAKRYLAS